MLSQASARLAASGSPSRLLPPLQSLVPRAVRLADLAARRRRSRGTAANPCSFSHAVRTGPSAGTLTMGEYQMAYDRYDTRDQSRDERSRWRDDRDQERGGREDRGFFERAGDEIASWFGDDDRERRRRDDNRREERGYGARPSDNSRERDMSRNRDHDRERDRNWNDNRGVFAGGGSSEGDYN